MTIMDDISGNGIFGEYVGVPTLGVAGAIVANVPGEEDTAAQFDGVNDKADVVNNNLINFNFNDAFTVELWIKTTATSGAVLAKGNAPYPYRLELVAGALSASRSDGTSTPVVVSAAVNNNAWHYVTFSSDGTTLTIQVDNITAVTVPDTTTATTTNTAGVEVAALNGGSFFAGTLDEIAIYPTVLTGGQRSTHYLAGTGA